MKTITINEKSTNIPVVDASDGIDIGSSSIPLFFKDTLNFTFLVINTQGDDGCLSQVLAHRSQIVSWNAYAISVDMKEDAFIDSEVQLSPDAYVELIGMQIRSEDGIMLGNVQSACVDFDSGELLSVTILQDEELQTYTPNQILSVDDRNIITIRQSNRIHAVAGDSAESEDYSLQSQRMSTEETADIKQMLMEITTLLKSFHEKNMTTESIAELQKYPAADVSEQADSVSFAGTNTLLDRLFSSSLETEPKDMASFSEAVDYEVPDNFKLDDWEKSVESIQTLPLSDAVAEPVGPMNSCSDDFIPNEHQAQLISRLINIESLLNDMSMRLDQGRESIFELFNINQQVQSSIDQPVQPSMNHESILTSKVSLMSEHENPVEETTSDVVEKLVLKSQSTAGPMQSAVEEDRIHLSASLDEIFSGNDSIPENINSQKESLPFTDYQDTLHTASAQAEPQLIKKTPERKPSTNSKIYWKTSGSQVLGMLLFVAATVTMSFFQLL